MSIRQPNKEQYEKAMNSFKQEMDSIKEKLDKISIPKDEFGQEKQEKRAIFQTLLKQKQEAQAKKSSVLNQMKQLQVIVKAQGESVQKELEKLGYKTPEEIQTRVNKLEAELNKGVDSLSEEKQIVAEISNLKKAKLRLLDLKKPKKESEREKLDQLRIELKDLDEKVKVLNEKVTEAKTVLTEVEKKQKDASGSIQSLYNKKKDLQTQLNTLKEKKSELYETFKKEQQDFKVHMDKVRSEQREEERKRRIAEREQKLMAQLERELEDAELGAFKGEIISCDALIAHFSTLLPSNKEKEEVVKQEVVDPNQPARSTVLVRKEDRDEVFFVGGGKKSKKAKQQSDKEKPLKLNLEMIDQLALLAVDIPKTTADLPKSIQQLQDKKVYYAENAAEQTEINKKTAMDKIRKLKEQLVAEASEE